MNVTAIARKAPPTIAGVEERHCQKVASRVPGVSGRGPAAPVGALQRHDQCA